MIGATVDFEFIPGKQYLDEDFRNSIEFSMYDSVFCIVDDENYDLDREFIKERLRNMKL